MKALNPWSRCTFGNVSCLCSAKHPSFAYLFSVSILDHVVLICIYIFKPKFKTWLTRKRSRWSKRSSRFLAVFSSPLSFSFFLLSFLLPEQKYSFHEKSFPPLSPWFLLLLVPKQILLYSEMNTVVH